ncbi:hypothetical protein PVAP13_6KG339706 [Panicum virgatum]|uniref:Uncharacterized protein n=1 Tax=Panicum virgatum TaxID=38727 RepID=A0A8T0RI81_PANVG|nr:hypothetical protein PVAP13_6KG339706 [Panicum virgatum]
MACTRTWIQSSPMRFFQLQPGEGVSTTTSAVLHGNSPSPRLSALMLGYGTTWPSKKNKKHRAWHGAAFTRATGVQVPATKSGMKGSKQGLRSSLSNSEG